MSEIMDANAGNDAGQPEREKKIKVWMIDDNMDIFLALSHKVKSKAPDLELISYLDGESALAALATEQPDIILVDGNLGSGHKSGAEIVAELKSRGVTAKIIAFSTSPSSNEAMIASGADLAHAKDYAILDDIHRLAKEL